VTLTLNDESGYFSIDANSVAVSDQENGKVITVTYAPMTIGNHTATITLSNPGADDKTVTINGTSIMETYVPHMLPVDSTYINLTQFRADWTDETPSKNVVNYTLEVSTRPAVELLDSLDGDNYTGGYGSITLPEPWGGYQIRGGNNSIYFNNYTSDPGYITYTIPEGYVNSEFTVEITTVTGYYGSGNYTIASEQTAAVGHTFQTGETFTWLVTGSSGENITFTSTDGSYSPEMSKVRIYSGDLNDRSALKATEEGDAEYRLITGITDMCYTVKELAEAGTFYYRVKALYTDGAESAWSNKETVTLFENGHAYALGDVDHSGNVNIADVTALISALLNGSEVCTICADVDGNGSITIADVTALINLLLSSNK